MHGNVVEIFSARNMTKADISRFIYDRGIPVLVCSDTFPAPRMVERIASAFSARLVTPREAMKISEKTRLTKERKQTLLSNRHERDALAAALFAYRKFRSVIDKIALFVQREKESGPIAENFVMMRTLLSGENIKNSISAFRHIRQRDML